MTPHSFVSSLMIKGAQSSDALMARQSQTDAVAKHRRRHFSNHSNV